MNECGLIGVYPGNVINDKINLLGALQKVFSVAFQTYDEKNLDAYIGVIIIDSDSFDLNGRVPTLRICTTEAGFGYSKGSSFVDFNDDIGLDKRLRKRFLCDRDYNELKFLIPRSDDSVLANINGNPIWARTRRDKTFHDRVSISFAELNKDESLVHYAYRCGFYSLIPIIHFIREIISDIDYLPPKPRACFIIDDANIRFRSYGSINFRNILEDANNYNFHVSLATVPFDLWWASKKSVNLFKNNSNRLSLNVHGNNHTSSEMAGENRHEENLETLITIRKRINLFGKRYGVKFSEVIVPPYGIVSASFLRTFAEFDFDAICVSSQFQRLDQQGENKLDIRDYSAIEWFPSDFILGSAIIPRRFPPMSKSEILFHVFLDKPVIIRYHPGQIKRNYDNLLRKAKFINSFEDMHWLSLGDISKSNYSLKIIGNTIYIRAYSNKICVDLPDFVTDIVLELPEIYGMNNLKYLFVNSIKYAVDETSYGYKTETFSSVTKGTQCFSLRFTERKNPRQGMQHKTKIVHVLRRLMSEITDRVLY